MTSSEQPTQQNGKNSNILVDPPKSPPIKPVSDWYLYKRLLSYMWPYMTSFILSIIGFSVYSAAVVGLADVMQYLVDALGESQKYDTGIISGIVSKLTGGGLDGLKKAAYLIPAAMMTLVLIRGLGYFVGNYCISDVTRSLIHDVRCELFEKMTRLPSHFFDNNTSGHLISRVTYNVEQITGALTNALRVAIREGTTVLFLVGYLVFINWKLTLIFGCVVPFIALVVYVVGKRFRRISRRIQSSMGDVTHVTSEMVNSYRVMRIFGGEEYEKGRFVTSSHDNMRQSMKMAATSAISAPTIQILVGFALCILVWLILRQDVGMTAGMYVSFITAAGLLAKPIRQLSEVQSLIQKGLAASQDIFQQLDEEPEPDHGTHSVDRVQGKVEFKAVNFAYQVNQHEVLKDISFTVMPGQTIALVGSSGSGKSTLVSLLTRFYDVDRGEILLDDINIANYTLSSLRKQIALVNQQVTLFNDTLFNNIAYGDLKTASREQVQHAVKLANASVFVTELSQGLETKVGDNGVLLSGGQRQRIAIARALLKDAPVLILDEATSALDNESERLIQAALEEVMKGRTTFVIAHRLSTIERADMILVMEEGRIVESGVHQALLAKSGRYAQLYQTQFVEQDSVI